MPAEFDTYRSTKILGAIIGTSLACGFGAGVLAFFAGPFLGPMVYPKSNLSPLSGIFWGPHALFIVTFLAGLCQIRRVTTLPTWCGAAYAVFLFLALIPSAFPSLAFTLIVSIPTFLMTAFG